MESCQTSESGQIIPGGLRVVRTATADGEQRGVPFRVRMAVPADDPASVVLMVRRLLPDGRESVMDVYRNQFSVAGYDLDHHCQTIRKAVTLGAIVPDVANT